MKDYNYIKKQVSNYIEENYKNIDENEKNILTNTMILNAIEHGILEDLYDDKEGYNLARKYFNLCFDKSLDVTKQINIDNRYITLDEATEFIVNIFNHLLYPISCVNKEEGLEILNQMKQYQEEKDLSFFTYILKYFDDEVICLQSILSKMTNPYSDFNLFNSKEKLYLLTNAVGTIYEYQGEQIVYQDLVKLNNELEDEIILNYQILENLSKTPQEMDDILLELDELVDEFEALMMSTKKEDQIKVKNIKYKDCLKKELIKY